jgi:hypothetical protein
MYDIFYIGQSSDNQYQKLKQRFVTAKCADDIAQAKRKSLTKFLWIVFDDLEICDDFDFSYEVDEWSSKYTHVFKNGNFYDGIALMPKNSHHGKGELKARFYIYKKLIDIVASHPLQKEYDIVFISYAEPNADDNYNALKARFPRAKRVHGVKGIHQAHIEAAKLCDTDMFWIVDGDAQIVDDFNFDYVPEYHNKEAVHVWRSQNPINGLVYGYGGIKLFPTQHTINMDVNKPDMTTSISSKFVAVKEVSNITAFNTDPFNTWKSAFRECCKLSSKVIDRQKEDETNNRLNIWCTKLQGDPLYGEYALKGAKAGAAYGIRNKNNIEALKRINDFTWLEDQFNGNV